LVLCVPGGHGFLYLGPDAGDVSPALREAAGVVAVDFEELTEPVG
jgi:hypothetical protein